MLTKEASHLYFYRFFTLLRLKPVSSGVEMLSTGVQNDKQLHYVKLFRFSYIEFNRCVCLSPRKALTFRVFMFRYYRLANFHFMEQNIDTMLAEAKIYVYLRSSNSC